MTQTFRTEGNYRDASRLGAAELRAAMAGGEILQATALAFDTRRQLRFELGGVRGVMPFADCAEGADTGAVRDIAVLTRVGRATCFVIEGMDEDAEGRPFYRLSRAKAQQLCRADYLDHLVPGDILPCTVTHIESFGAFCDVGCGISALLPIDCMSVSRISSPADRVSVGQQILCAIRITHLPTGMVVECQNERSQFQNKDKALEILRSRLLAQKQSEQQSAINAGRQAQVGTGDRSEKIRTYNFPQDRCTDHRIGLTVHNLDKIMDGALDEVLDALILHEQAEKLSRLQP